MTPAAKPVSIRARGQVRNYLLVTLFMLVTVGSAAATVMMPSRPRPTPLDELRDELTEIVEGRRARIAELEATVGDRCDRFAAHERTMLLVMDGRWEDGRAYADRYEAKCGSDPNVRRWANAPIPKAQRVIAARLL